MSGEHGPDPERLQQASEWGRRAQQAQRAALERRVDPDGTLGPEERERRVRAIYSERAKRAAATMRKRRSARPAPAKKATVTAAERGGPGRAPSVNQPDPVIWDRPDVRAALAAHDIGAVYRVLAGTGMSQRAIAYLTGTKQPEVSDAIGGRPVITYVVLDRIATGLGIPRELMGLSWGAADRDSGAYSGAVTVATPEGVLGMLRRHLLALGGLSAFGAVVPGLGELQEDPLPIPSMPGELPGRIGQPDVELIRDWGTQVRTLARAHGGEGRASVALASWADQWLAADASEPVRRELLCALSEVHTTAAWCCHDSGAVARSHWHFGRAVELATDADDAYRAAYAMRHAAMMLIERGHPNDGLKAIQMSAVRLDAAEPDDERVPVLRSWCHAVGALALAKLDDGRKGTVAQARSELAAARDGWTPPTTHARADMDLFGALTWSCLGELDRAEAAAAQSVETFGDNRREGIVAELTLARLHVQTGEPHGLTLARDAVGAVAKTRSAVARQVWLPPLVDALEARPGGEAAELAHSLRKVATVAV